MHRGPKPAKSNAKPPVARKSPKNEDSRVRDVEKRLAEALRDKAEALEQQTAIREILRAIRSSPMDLQPVLSVPLLREDKAIGTINLRRTDVSPFTETQIALLQTFADQAVIAIENVRLFTELQERNRELLQALDRETATGEILRVINNSPTSVEPVFKAILANGMRLCQADVGLLFLVEGDTSQCVADRGAPPEFVEPRRHSHRSGPYTGITRAIRERRPIHIEDLMADRAYTERDPRDCKPWSCWAHGPVYGFRCLRKMRRSACW
jgi:GAF domain-containing protein